MADTFLEACLEENFISIQAVPLREIVRESPSRSTWRTGVIAVKDSIVFNGYDKTTYMHLYTLSEAERASTGKLYGIINGANRLQAQQELDIERPWLNLPSHVNAKIYRAFRPQVKILISGMINELPSILPTKKPSVLDSVHLLWELMKAEKAQSSIPNCPPEEHLQRTVEHYMNLGFTIAHCQLLDTAEGFFNWAIGTTGEMINFYIQTNQIRSFTFDSMFTEEIATAFWQATSDRKEKVRGAMLYRIADEGVAISHLGPPDRIMGCLLGSIRRAKERIKVFRRRVQEIELLSILPKTSDLTVEEKHHCDNMYFYNRGVQQDFNNFIDQRQAAIDDLKALSQDE